MKNQIITFISDTHTKHKQIEKDLPGGDIIIHSGDMSSVGHKHEIENFCKWFDKLDYTHKIFIAGNHDFLFEKNPTESYNIIKSFDNITYLEDNLIIVNDIKIWGSPWQPEFYNWAFNLPKNGIELEEKWNNIPPDVNILITHGPPFGHLDAVINENINLGCQLLENRIEKIKPNIHIFGHIHSGYGYKFYNNTHFINASVLNEQYQYTQLPITIEWNKNSNDIKFITKL